MKALKPAKKSAKYDRERKVLIGLVEHFLKNGKAVGSNTLKECGFVDLSSATIRNYFAHLEEEGYLMQQHASGGRIPTDKAYRLYAEDCSTTINDHFEQTEEFTNLRNSETREIAAFLQRAAEKLSEITNSAVFLSAPRFEHDFIVGIRLMAIDHTRYLCVLITDFGEVVTEILQTPKKLGGFTIKRIEEYFHWRLTGIDKPESLSKEEEEVAQSFYNELMVRYIVSYSNFDSEEIYRTGFSRLLSYPEFQDPTLLAQSLDIFENTHGMRLLLKECSKHDTLKFWIGDDLTTYSPRPNPNCSVLAIPYRVNKQPVGAVGMLGPVRIPYRQLFSILHSFAENVSEALTNSLYKFKINMRQPKYKEIAFTKADLQLIGQTIRLPIENKSAEKN